MAPERMGKLVGGAQIVECSGPGKFRYGNESWREYSADKITYASEKDKKLNYSIREQWFFGENDCVLAQKEGCNCEK